MLKTLRNCAVKIDFNLFKPDFLNSLTMDAHFALEFNTNQSLMNFKLSGL